MKQTMLKTNRIREGLEFPCSACGREAGSIKLQQIVLRVKEHRMQILPLTVFMEVYYKSVNVHDDYTPLSVCLLS